jgi:hypothetical protein
MSNSTIVQASQPPHWHFVRQAGDTTAIPPAPTAEALWLGHGCIVRYVEGEHVPTATLLEFAAICAADCAIGSWEAQDATALAKAATVEAQRPNADPHYVARLAYRAALAATNRSLTREDWDAWGLGEVALGAKKAGKSQGEIAEVIEYTRVEKRRMAFKRQSEILEALLLELVPACAREMSAVSG